MRRLFLLLLVTLAAAGTLAWLVRRDAGYVLVQFHGTSVETTVWFALAAAAVALVAFYYAARVLLFALGALSRITGGAPRAPRRSGRSAAARGAIAWAEGRWSAAAKLLATAAPHADAPLLNYLLAARAAASAGDASLARGFLALADGVSGAQAAVAIDRARLQLGAGEANAALATLDAIAGGQCPAALELLLDVLPACGEWQRVLESLPEARRLGLRPPDDLDGIEQRACAALLARAGTRPDALRAAWNAMPAAARAQPALLAAYVLALQAAGCGAEAADLLEHGLSARWEPDLVRALGLVHSADPVKQLARMERLLTKHPGDATLLLALGRLALACRMWGKARDYLEASLARAARAETCAELARASEQLGDADKARSLRERAVALVLDSGGAAAPAGLRA